MLPPLPAGTRAPVLAAALAVAIAGVLTQADASTAAEREVLYLDAPIVSEERAAKAGRVADSLSMADGAVPEIFAWLSVPIKEPGTGAPPVSVMRALASVTARDGGNGVTPTDAALAGDVMVAQLEGAQAGSDGSEFASTEGVRPRLGDGSDADEGETPEPTGREGEGPSGEPGITEFALVEEPSVSTPAPAENATTVLPDGSAGMTLPVPAHDEGPVPPSDLAPPKPIENLRSPRLSYRRRRRANQRRPRWVPRNRRICRSRCGSRQRPVQPVWRTPR